ncbi:Magnesium transporter MRS2-2 [Zea mays]|uniref:Magnesium transporter MRS2-2 n=1 Tax=Zea mays TaxID=4577 RepID=A0A1D6KR46_MAIZE|nr:Magnesium transporter MRS2-2 [Zea mays]
MSDQSIGKYQYNLRIFCFSINEKVRDELEQLLDDDDDMADLYLSRKLAGASSPVSGSVRPNWFPASPTIGSKISRASRASAATVHGNENDVEELEMLLEAYFMQIDGTLTKLTTLREYIDDTEDYINIQLDNHRNQLIQDIHVYYLQKVIEKGEDGRGGTSQICFSMQHLWVPLRCP